MKENHGAQIDILSLTYSSQTQIIISGINIRASPVGHMESAGVAALSFPAEMQAKLPKGCLYQLI